MADWQPSLALPFLLPGKAAEVAINKRSLCERVTQPKLPNLTTAELRPAQLRVFARRVGEAALQNALAPSGSRRGRRT